MKTQPSIRKIFWLALPLIWIIGQSVAELFSDTDLFIKLHSENGLHEWLQFGIIVTIFALSFITLTKMNRKANLWLTAWITALFLGSLYIGLEEISFGQSVFGWETPESWMALNYQNETNLHNTSKWLNQKPRLILEVGIIVGGLIIPALNKFKPKWLPTHFALIYPPAILAVTAGIYTVAKFSHKFSRIFFDEKIFYRSSEIEELYLYFFLLLYTIILKERVLNKSSKS